MVKIGEHLAKLEANIEWFHFCPETVYKMAAGRQFEKRNRHISATV